MSLKPSISFTGCGVDTEDWALLFKAIEVRLTESIATLPDCGSAAALHATHTTMLDCMQALEHLHRTTLAELDRRQSALNQAMQALANGGGNATGTAR